MNEYNPIPKWIEGNYESIFSLQNYLNEVLQNYYNSIRLEPREMKAELIISKVEAIVDDLNSSGFNFGRVEYSGDVQFEQSEQHYSQILDSKNELTIRFLGFSAQVSIYINS